MRALIAALLLTLGVALGVGNTPAFAQEHGASAHRAAADAEHNVAEGAEPQPELLRSVNEGAITAVTTLIVFLLLVVILGKFAWGPIASGLKAREDKIRKDIQDAEAARARAEATLADYNRQLAGAEEKTRQILSAAATDAERIATNIRMKAQQESEEIKERASKDIEAARDAALREIYERTAELATGVAEKIIRRNLNAADQQDLVNDSLNQLATVK